MNFRIATIADMELLIRLRKQLLMDEGQILSSNIDQELKQFFTQQMTSHQLTQWLVECEGEVIASGAIQFISFPPSFFNTTGIRGYIMNMYTHPAYRKRGIAKRLMDLLIEEARIRKVHHIFLIASYMGKPLYKKYGFSENDIYMEYFL